MSDSIEIVNFVERSEILPAYYSDSYYLSPEKVAVDLFALLYKAMINAGKVEAGKIVMRSKENPVGKDGITWVDPSLQIDRL
jgi:non-homologous end joining protein Ku